MASSHLASPHDVSGRLLFAVFALMIASFIGTMFYLQYAERTAHSRTVDIRELTTESVVRLARINALALETELAMSDYLNQPAERAERGQRLEASIAQLQQQVRSYLTLEVLPGERSYWLDIQESTVRFHEAVLSTRELADSGRQRSAQDMYAQKVQRTAGEVTSATTRGIEFDAGLGRVIAADLSNALERARWIATGMTAFCVLLGLAAGWLVQRRARLRRTFAAARASMLEARAAELEKFAGRVAHDIRNPLAAAKLATELVERYAQDDRAREPTGMLKRALSRADAITSGLLQFARAGAQNPDPGARASVRTVIEDVATGMAPDAERTNVAIRVESVPPVLVACSDGVYMSMLGNLVRNAVKYMGTSSRREVTLRVMDDGAFVRTEVADTGPGIAEASLASLFEPYFRANTGGQEGLGLGLATVKKLAEGHGGRVGVVSKLGEGSTFWFELPCAGSDSDLHLCEEAPDTDGLAAHH